MLKIGIFRKWHKKIFNSLPEISDNAECQSHRLQADWLGQFARISKAGFASFLIEVGLNSGEIFRKNRKNGKQREF